MNNNNYKKYLKYKKKYLELQKKYGGMLEKKDMMNENEKDHILTKIGIEREFPILLKIPTKLYLKYFPDNIIENISEIYVILEDIRLIYIENNNEQPLSDYITKILQDNHHTPMDENIKEFIRKILIIYKEIFVIMKKMNVYTNTVFEYTNTIFEISFDNFLEYIKYKNYIDLLDISPNQTINSLLLGLSCLTNVPLSNNYDKVDDYSYSHNIYIDIIQRNI